jgi:hypothetical protein
MKDDHDPVDQWLTYKAGSMASGVLAVLYVVFLIRFPAYWAMATAVVFVIVSGLFTSKIVLGFQSPQAILGLSPVIGIGWLLFSWLLFRIAG